MEPRPGVFTPKQTAMVLQMSEDKVRRLLRKGVIPGAQRIEGEWRIPVQPLYQWLHCPWPKERAEHGTPGSRT